MKSKCVLALCICLLLGGAQTIGQPADGMAPAESLADSPVARMVGEWVGEGWAIQQTGVRETFAARERARWNLAGTAIIVEGLGTNFDEETGDVTIGHNALGTIESGESPDEWNIHVMRAGEGYSTRQLRFDEESGSLHWGPQTPPGTIVRFTIHLSETEWHEIGEFSRDDGATWVQFLEMRLKRIEG